MHRRAALVFVLLLPAASAHSQVESAAPGGELVLTETDRQLLGEPAGGGLAGDRLERRTESLTSRMRCPVCQGLSIADSPTPAALAMKARVEALLAAGYSEEQILGYFEASYGEFIRLAPKPGGLNLVVWMLPIVALVAAAAWLTLRARRAGAGKADDDLDEYVRRVRQEVER